MSEMAFKLYPKSSKDEGGLKFYFDHNNKHFTIRLAGKPILILEAKFKQLGGTDFNGSYDCAKSNKPHPELNLLSQAVKQVNDFLITLEEVGKLGRSPFVVYIKDKNEFKS